ncbi:MAG TPA: hypothetical protein VIL03_01745 [Clostridia bacterium]|jgi:hypothetical protein
MKNAKISLVIILILFSAVSFLGCGQTIKNQPEKSIISEESDILHEETPPESDQLSEDETPNTIEDYQEPTQPIVLEPLEAQHPKLYNIDKTWQVEVSKEQVLLVLEKMRIQISAITPIIIDTKDEQGCCAIISIGGKLINAYEFCDRLNLPSSYITEIEIKDDYIIFRGQGYFAPNE